MNMDEAIKATKNGAIAALISGVVTFIITLIAITSDSEGVMSIWNDSLIFFDVGFIFLCAFGMYKKSRLAAVVIFFYFIVAKIIISIELNSVKGVSVALILLYFYGRAIQGSYVFHNLEKKNNPEYTSTPMWVIILSSTVGVLFLALATFGFLEEYGYINLESAGSKDISELEISINRNQSWDNSSIEGYSKFFSKLLYENMLVNETLKKIDASTLQKEAVKYGKCMTNNLMKNYANPSVILEGIKSQDNNIFSEISRLKSLCFST